MRIGLIRDSTALPAWLHRAVERLAAMEGTRIVLDLRDAAPPPLQGLERLRSAPFRLYERLDRRVFAAGPDPLSPVPDGPLLEGVETAAVSRSIADPDELDEASLERLREADLDVLLHLGRRRLGGAALLAPRLGVWTWDVLEDERRGASRLVAAVLGAESVCETALLALRWDAEGHRLLYRSFATSDGHAEHDPEPVSLHRARAPALWKSASFPERVLRRFERNASKPIGDLPIAEPCPKGDRLPGPLRSAAFAARVLSRLIRRRHRLWFRPTHWYLALRPGRGDEPGVAMDGFTPIPSPADRYYADPFLVREEGRSWLFFEDADRRSGMGRLACAEIDSAGRPGPPFTVLAREYHLSYPCVFRWKGDWWMIPETNSRRRLELYRAIEFPQRWTRERTLFEGVRAVDPTVHPHDGRLWMFVGTDLGGGAPQDELFLFHADDPRGPWLPHPDNPILSDVRRARPAGALFVHKGELIRPSQDCGLTYGGAIWLNRVEVLNEREYREKPLRRIGPEWRAANVATHTLARSEAFEVVDGRARLGRVFGRAGA